MDTLKDILLNLKDKNNTGITIIKGYNDRMFISYQELYIQSNCYLNRMKVLGVQTGQEFIIIFDDHEEFFYLFWACILGDIIPIPVSIKGSSIDKVINILEYCEDPYIYCGNEKAGQAICEKVSKERILTYYNFNSLEQCFKEDYVTTTNKNEKNIVFIQFSSGSTSSPKGIMLGNHNIICNIRSMMKIRNITSKDKFLSWMPLTHDMGLIFFHLSPMFLGVNQILIPTSTFILHPLLWMQTISNEKATVTGGTNFCLEYFLRRLKSTEHLDWDLSSLNHLILGAEMISVDLCSDFINTMKDYSLKKECLAPGYGLAEATLCVSLTKHGSLYKSLLLDRSLLSIGNKVKFTNKESNLHTSIMCVGNIIDDSVVRIIDLEGKVLGDDFVGIICVKGSNVASGYYNNPVLTNETIDKDRWLNTGDIGFIHDNQLYITGRYKDIIFYNGKSYFSNDLEELIIEKGLARRNEVVVIGIRTEDSDINDHLVCYVRNKGKNLEKFYEKSMKIKQIISIYAGINIKEIIPVQKIPKTTSGKMQRFELKERYLNQEWNHVLEELQIIDNKFKEESDTRQSMRSEDIENIVADCFTNVIGIDVATDENLTEYSLSSLSITKIYNQLNEKFPQMISVADIYEYSTISLLANHIRTQLCK